jgi:hypothetical protein
MAQGSSTGSRPRQRWPEGVDVKVWHRYFGSHFGDEGLEAPTFVSTYVTDSIRQAAQRLRASAGPRS